MAHQSSGPCLELFKLLSDEYFLASKTINYHWNVKGPQFFEEHHLFEEQYRWLLETMDGLAERIRAFGVTVPVKHALFAQESQIGEGDSELSNLEMIDDLLKGHVMITQNIEHAIPIFEKAKDYGSHDFVTSLLIAHQKHAWMLRSHLES